MNFLTRIARKFFFLLLFYYSGVGVSVALEDIMGNAQDKDPEQFSDHVFASWLNVSWQISYLLTLRLFNMEP